MCCVSLISDPLKFTPFRIPALFSLAASTWGGDLSLTEVLSPCRPFRALFSKSSDLHLFHSLGFVQTFADLISPRTNAMPSGFNIKSATGYQDRSMSDGWTRIPGISCQGLPSGVLSYTYPSHLAISIQC